VRIVGSDLGPMTAVAEIALGLGLEVWFSPAFFEYPLEETAARLVAAAEAATPLYSPSGACGLRRRQRAHALRTRAGRRQKRDLINSKVGQC
jgi:tRNA U34 5-methylaminomethyl-2-thiouridine-forming methyltransferase MnmC